MSDAFWNNLPTTLIAIGGIITPILLHLRAVRKLDENTQLTRETKQVVANGLSGSVENIEKELIRTTEFAKGLAAGKLAAEQAANEKGH